MVASSAPPILRNLVGQENSIESMGAKSEEIAAATAPEEEAVAIDSKVASIDDSPPAVEPVSSTEEDVRDEPTPRFQFGRGYDMYAQSLRQVEEQEAQKSIMSGVSLARKMSNAISSIARSFSKDESVKADPAKPEEPVEEQPAETPAEHPAEMPAEEPEEFPAPAEPEQQTEADTPPVNETTTETEVKSESGSGKSSKKSGKAKKSHKNKYKYNKDDRTEQTADSDNPDEDMKVLAKEVSENLQTIIKTFSGDADTDKKSKSGKSFWQNWFMCW